MPRRFVKPPDQKKALLRLVAILPVILLISTSGLSPYFQTFSATITRMPVGFDIQQDITLLPTDEQPTLTQTVTTTFIPPNETIPPSPTLTLSPTLLTIQPSLADTWTPEGVHTEEVLIRIKPANNSGKMAEMLGIEIKDVGLSILGIYVVELPSDDLSTRLAELDTTPGIVYAEPNYIVEGADTIPNDSGWSLQYGPSAIRAPQGWDHSTGSSAVTIAILDTGVDLSHPEIASKIVAGYDFVNSDLIPQDDHGHGTHVAGIAAAIGNNGQGIAGISWGARIMPVKVLNFANTGSYANVAAGIVWAADHGAQIINMSLGGANPSLVLADAVNYAASKGVLMVAAAGNGGTVNVLYPARYPDVIAVAGTDASNNHMLLSNYGPEVDVSAPGSSIYSLALGGGYTYLSGTSMATPHVTGLAAVLLGIPGNASAGLVRSQIENSALDLGVPGWDAYTGAGLIQMDAAIALIPMSVTTTPTIDISDEPNQSEADASSIRPFLPSIRNSPSPTWTLTSTQTITASPTPTVLILTTFSTITETITVTVTYSGSSPHTTSEENNPSVLLPCAGFSLIFLGTAIAFILLRAKRDSYF